MRIVAEIVPRQTEQWPEGSHNKQLNFTYRKKSPDFGFLAYKPHCEQSSSCSTHTCSLVWGQSFLSALGFQVHLLGRLGGTKGQSLGMLEPDRESLAALGFLVRMAGIGASGG